jgi:hypothetical protein
MPKTIHILGEGGSIIEMDLPLSEPIADRMAKGYLKQVNPDGTPWTKPRGDVPGLPTSRPAVTANKAAWVGWAVKQGAKPDDAEAWTKTDLIEKYGT